MIDLETIKRESKIIREKIECPSSDEELISLAYDSFDIESLIMVLENKPIEQTPSLDDFFDYVMLHDEKITETFLSELYENSEFYEAQAHNVLTRFSLENFGIDSPQETNERIFTEKETLEIIRTFLNSYDEKLDKLFMNMRENGQIGTISNFNLSKGIDGKCFWINSLNKTYILSGEKYNTLSTMSLLIHELGHAYEFNLLTGKSLESRQGIYATLHTEVTSTFFENAFNEFLRENEIKKIEVFNIKERYLKLLFEQFYQAYFVFHSKNFTNGTYFVKVRSGEYRKILKKIIHEFGYDIDLIDHEFNINSLLSYGNSMLTSLKLYEIYKDNPSFFKKEFDRIILSYGIEKNPSIYNCLGISDEDMCEATILESEFEKQKHLALSLGIKK